MSLRVYAFVGVICAMPLGRVNVFVSASFLFGCSGFILREFGSLSLFLSVLLLTPFISFGACWRRVSMLRFVVSSRHCQSCSLEFNDVGLNFV